MDRQHIKAMAEKYGVKKPIMKGDYSEAFYALFDEVVRITHLGSTAMAEDRFRRLRDEAEKLRLKGEGDGKIATAQLSEVLDAK